MRRRVLQAKHKLRKTEMMYFACDPQHPVKTLRMHAIENSTCNLIIKISMQKPRHLTTLMIKRRFTIRMNIQ